MRNKLNEFKKVITIMEKLDNSYKSKDGIEFLNNILFFFKKDLDLILELLGRYTEDESIINKVGFNNCYNNLCKIKNDCHKQENSDFCFTIMNFYYNNDIYHVIDILKNELKK